MADTSKKKGAGQGASKKAAVVEAAPSAAAPAEKPVEKAELARAADAHHEGAHGDAHAHKPNIREYLIIFAVLAILTLIEVGVAKVPGINRGLMALALVSLAVTKAAIVGLYYMHLKHETKVLKLTVALPVAAPAFYALVLMSEAAWRLTRF
jgi:cytochrome c oxidase subunit IV